MKDRRPVWLLMIVIHLLQLMTGCFQLGNPQRASLNLIQLRQRESSMLSSGDVTTPSAQTNGLESLAKPSPVSNSSGGTLMGVIRGSGLGVLKSDTSYSGPSAGVSISNAAVPLTMAGSSTNADTSSVATPFRTDVSALGSYTPPVAAGSGRRRFSEMPLPSASAHKEQPQNSYRDRAAERRSLYGSSSVGDDLPDADLRKL
ncbi:hypothetical protein OIU77_001316 [Salix suchowensis]|uniref:Uncharacterized protein n=1 Tax=Salix suchowensis TaxID=1278906 RepID=A0ABQ9B0Z4_9ROSI|nr:hypothetical protein OIU77_001316 [Salix suchowensis]